MPPLQRVYLDAKKFWQKTSHQMFGHVHGVLNEIARFPFKKFTGKDLNTAKDWLCRIGRKLCNKQKIFHDELQIEHDKIQQSTSLGAINGNICITCPHIEKQLC